MFNVHHFRTGRQGISTVLIFLGNPWEILRMHSSKKVFPLAAFEVLPFMPTSILRLFFMISSNTFMFRFGKKLDVFAWFGVLCSFVKICFLTVILQRECWGILFIYLYCGRCVCSCRGLLKGCRRIWLCNYIYLFNASRIKDCGAKLKVIFFVNKKNAFK